MKKAKTIVKVFTKGDMTALMHVTTEAETNRKLAFVNWFRFNPDKEGLIEIERWLPFNENLQKLYEIVYRYAEKMDFNLWKY